VKLDAFPQTNNADGDMRRLAKKLLPTFSEIGASFSGSTALCKGVQSDGKQFSTPLLSSFSNLKVPTRSLQGVLSAKAPCESRAN